MTDPERIIQPVRRPIFGLLREGRRETAFRRASPRVWWVTLLAPLLVTVIALGVMWIVRGGTATAGLVGLAVSSLFFGKFIILGGADGSAVLVSPETLVLIVVAMDVMTACWFVYHLGFMLRLPVVGPRFTLLIEDGEYVMAAHPWIRRAAFVGLVVFVMIPFAMTGSVGGAILARLLGMSRRATFTAICIGSVLGAGLIYASGEVLGTFLDQENPVWAAGGVIVLIVLILMINYRYAQAIAKIRNNSDPST